MVKSGPDISSDKKDIVVRFINGNFSCEILELINPLCTFPLNP